eukprot:1161311-Pelagomonas_calceolata.AAC.6
MDTQGRVYSIYVPYLVPTAVRTEQSEDRYPGRSPPKFELQAKVAGWMALRAQWETSRIASLSSSAYDMCPTCSA